jgi:hypothetical protein
LFFKSTFFGWGMDVSHLHFISSSSHVLSKCIN